MAETSLKMKGDRLELGLSIYERVPASDLYVHIASSIIRLTCESAQTHQGPELQCPLKVKVDLN